MEIIWILIQCIIYFLAQIVSFFAFVSVFRLAPVPHLFLTKLNWFYIYHNLFRTFTWNLIILQKKEEKEDEEEAVNKQAKHFGLAFLEK